MLKRAAIFGALFFISTCLAPLPAQAQTPDEIKAAEETYIPGLKLYPAPTLESQGLRIAYVSETVQPGNGRYTCGGLNVSQVQEAATVAIAALKKIPAVAWPKINMKYLLLCSETRAGDRAIGGIPVPPIQLLMLATGADPARSRFAYTLVHELFHMAEMQNGGLNDTAWDSRFTGYDNSYGPTAGQTQLGSGGAGFINGYGKSFAHEERAEIFALHILSSQVLQQFVSQQRDAALQDKINAVRVKAQQMLGTPL